MEDGEFFDVLDMLDGRVDAADECDPSPQSRGKDKPQNLHHQEDGVWGGVHNDNDGEESGRGSEDAEEEVENDELRISASESDNESPEALVELENFLSSLDPAVTKKRKQGQESAEAPTKKRRILPERTEAGEENEFGMRGKWLLGLLRSQLSFHHSDPNVLNLEDLLAPLASTSAHSALKKSTKPLALSGSKTKTLPAPLPQRAQEQLDRQAAYEQTKQEIDKWSATMKRIKEAGDLAMYCWTDAEYRSHHLGGAPEFSSSSKTS